MKKKILAALVISACSVSAFAADGVPSFVESTAQFRVNIGTTAPETVQILNVRDSAIVHAAGTATASTVFGDQGHATFDSFCLVSSSGSKVNVEVVPSTISATVTTNGHSMGQVENGSAIKKFYTVAVAEGGGLTKESVAFKPVLNSMKAFDQTVRSAANCPASGTHTKMVFSKFAAGDEAETGYAANVTMKVKPI